MEWLTQSPVTDFLEQRGEKVHPASAHLASESAHIESESGEHDLHAFQAIRRMDEVLVNNFMVFDDLVSRESFDLWVGDEAWDLDHFLHENPELKRAPFVWMTDFVGWLPMPDGGEREAFLTADYNAEMVEHVAQVPVTARPVGVRRRPRRRGRPAAGSEPAERPRVDQGALRVRRLRDGPTPRSGASATALRARLGYCRRTTWSAWSASAAPVSARTCCAAWLRRTTRRRRRIPNLRMVVVTGPRIDPATHRGAGGCRGPRVPARPRPAPCRL